MGKGFEYNFCADGVLVKKYGSQKETACCVIEYIFNQSNADDLKEIIFNYYQTEAFDASGTSLQFNGKKYKVKDTCWAKEKFWVFQILVCYNINEIINNRKSIKNYSDFEQYRNNKFWIESASKALDEDQISAQQDAVRIVCSWSEIPVKHQKKLRCTVPSKEFTSGSRKTETGNISIQEIKDARTQMAFCDEAIVSTSDIVDVLAGENGFFPSEEMKKILTERYEKMRKNHLKTDWTDLDWTQKNPRPNSEGLKIVPQNNDYDAALLQVPGEYCYQSGTGDWKEKLFKTYDNIGHDMPVWLYYQNDPQNRPLSQRPRVMIVSQDPLRSGYPKNDVLLLSTPWAHHSLKFLENPDAARSKVLNIIHSFLQKGAIAYLTDVHKLYFTLHGKKLKELKELQKNESDPNKKIDLGRQFCDFEEMIQKLKQSRKKFLDEEITLFQPNIIISMGIEAADVLTGSWDKHKDTVYQNRVYVKYHPGAPLNYNPRGNDPTYWLRTENGENDSFII